METRTHLNASLPSSESRDVSPKETTSKNDGPNKRKALQRKQDEGETTLCLKSIAETLAKPINIDSLQEEDEEDEEDIFGCLVAMKLRRITNPWMRTKSTMSINRVLMDAEYSLNNCDCHQLSPSTDLLDSARRATGAYNVEHRQV